MTLYRVNQWSRVGARAAGTSSRTAQSWCSPASASTPSIRPTAVAAVPPFYHSCTQSISLTYDQSCRYESDSSFSHEKKKPGSGSDLKDVQPKNKLLNKVEHVMIQRTFYRDSAPGVHFISKRPENPDSIRTAWLRAGSDPQLCVLP